VNRRVASGARSPLGAILLALVAVVALAVILSCTAAPALAALPDNRAYEPVSPVETEGNSTVYVPGAGSGYLSINSSRGVETKRPFEVASDGEAVVYEGDPPTTGGGAQLGQGNGDAYFARRSAAGGWTAVDIEPPSSVSLASEYLAFSSDLSIGILNSFGSLTGDAPPGAVYAYETNGSGGYTPLVTGARSAEVLAGGNAGANGAPAFSDILLESQNDLLEGEGALEKALRKAVETARGEGKTPSVLYDSAAGRPYLVSILPDGEPDADASFGSFPTTAEESAPGLSHAISADGSRIFWTDETTDALYVRENAASPDAATVQLDAAEPRCGSCVGGGGKFWTASGDGSKVFFSDEKPLTANSTAEAGKPNLYEYELSGETGGAGVLTDLTAIAGADVQGVVGASEDGSYVYLVAGGVLAANKNSIGEEATAGSCEVAGTEEERHGDIPAGKGCNLYLFDAGEPQPLRFIASLTASEDGGEGKSGVVPFDGALGGEEHRSGDWQAAGGYETAEVTPGGRDLLFMSNRRLTGYDNEGVKADSLETSNLDEVFLYQAGAEAGAGTLRCVSCNPSGEPPALTELSASEQGPVGGFIPITKVQYYRAQPRVISEDGGRVFFDSGEPLTPSATNGWLGVYEWEAPGEGTCGTQEASPATGGCTFLISGGVDPENSYLIGSDASGANAFFVTAAELSARDRNHSEDVYDAHECTSASPCPPEVSSTACAGTGCQGVPPAPPIFATPSSVTITGVDDNPPPPPPTVVKGKPKVVKCKRNFVKKKIKKKEVCVRNKGKKTSSKRGAKR
jgi:hypothetical protein